MKLSLRILSLCLLLALMLTSFASCEKKKRETTTTTSSSSTAGSTTTLTPSTTVTTTTPAQLYEGFGHGDMGWKKPASTWIISQTLAFAREYLS